VLKQLSKLKGIGSSLLSLLLAVNDLKGTVFLPHATYRWLFPERNQSVINLHRKEHFKLQSKTKEIIGRLGTNASDIGKVAYVSPRIL
jgi:hypothetical protein